MQQHIAGLPPPGLVQCRQVFRDVAMSDLSPFRSSGSSAGINDHSGGLGIARYWMDGFPGALCKECIKMLPAGGLYIDTLFQISKPRDEWLQAIFVRYVCEKETGARIT